MRFAPPILIGLAVSLVGCGDAEDAADIGKVVGAATYREDMAVPSGTRLEVTLTDASAPSPATGLVTRIVVAKAGQPPYSFEVPYRRSDIDSDHRYVLDARLLDRENVLFELPEPVPVVTGGRPSEVELLLRRPDDSARGEQTADGVDLPPQLDRLPATFTGTLPCADCEGIEHHLDLFADETFHLRTVRLGDDDAATDNIGRWAWVPGEGALVLQGGYESPMRFQPIGEERLGPIEGEAGNASGPGRDDVLQRSASFEPIRPELRMRGMYSYLADAATFMECRTGRRMPVAQEAANIELERGYLDADPAPGEGLMAVITGRIVQRPPMDGNVPEPTVVPLAFHAVRPGETCGTPFSRAELKGTYWKLTRMGDESIIPIVESREPHIVLNADGGMTGSDGCNRLRASYEIDGDTIGFGEIGTTRMACPQGEEQARQFRTALDRVSRYRVVGSHLELFNEAGEMLARFEAVYVD